MPRTRPPYPEEFRNRIIELARNGRTPAELAEEFEPTEQTIRNWLKQADRDGGSRGLSAGGDRSGPDAGDPAGGPLDSGGPRHVPPTRASPMRAALAFHSARRFFYCSFVAEALLSAPAQASNRAATWKSFSLGVSLSLLNDGETIHSLGGHGGAGRSRSPSTELAPPERMNSGCPM